MEKQNRVLIVEDDQGSEALLERIVRSLDPRAKVEWVQSAETAALTIVQERTHGRHYSLVISDIFLNGKLTGIDLWKIYQEFMPRPPVVLTSSLAVPRFLEAAEEVGGAPPFLPKPFYAEECRQLIQRFLANL